MCCVVQYVVYCAGWWWQWRDGQLRCREVQKNLVVGSHVYGIWSWLRKKWRLTPGPNISRLLSDLDWILWTSRRCVVVDKFTNEDRTISASCRSYFLFFLSFYSPVSVSCSNLILWHGFRRTTQCASGGLFCRSRWLCELQICKSLTELYIFVPSWYHGFDVSPICC